MLGVELVDELFAAFVDTLHPSLAQYAKRLPYELGLSSRPDTKWSDVFAHEVTLGAPALFADAMPSVTPGVLRHAIAAQTFAVIEAFGTDRIEDAQVAMTPELLAVLGALRRAASRALGRVCPGVADPSIDCDAAHAATLAAIAEERRILARRGPVGLRTYEATSLGKQSVGFPASIGLAFAAGWDARLRRTLHRTLASIWVGLQLVDDATDWEDDFARGGAWAYSLGLGLRDDRHAAKVSGSFEPIDVVWSTRALSMMLERARFHFHAVASRAMALGAPRLASWAVERERTTASMARGEARSPGYVKRMHALNPWALEVLG